MLLDFDHVCDSHANTALEQMFKAIGEDPAEDAIWDQHPNPYLRRIVDLFTQRGLDRIAGVQNELNGWLSGNMHLPAHQRPTRPAGLMARWSESEIGLVRLYLQSLPPGEFGPDDWGLLVDYLVQRYLPPDDLRTESDWLATRSSIMGRIEAARGADVAPEDADALLEKMPVTGAVAADQFGMSAVQRAVMAYGAARCAENVTALTDAGRHRIRRAIMDYQEAQFLGDRSVTAESLETKLFDSFGTMNRDWRRIAVTESTENLNQGLIASLKPGSRVRRVEKYRGACAFCRSIDGRIMEVVAADAADKDGETQIWPGKTNVGRSAAPRKKVGDTLIEREPHERLWVAAGTMHPNCRGSWVELKESTLPVDPEFSKWMDEVLGRR